MSTFHIWNYVLHSFEDTWINDEIQRLLSFIYHIINQIFEIYHK